MASPAERPKNLQDVVQLFQRYRGRVLLWCAGVAGLTLLALIWAPRKYQSEAKIHVRLGRESVALDPTATTGAMLQVVESREGQIISVRDMLGSRALLESVVKKLGPETILKGPPSSQSKGGKALLSKLISAIPRPRFSKPVTPTEQAIEKLSRSYTVEVARNSSVLTVHFKAKTPELAKMINEAFLEAYQQQHWAANRTPGSFEFFTDQTTQLKQRLDYATTQLRDAKNDSQLVSIPVEQQALQNQLTQVEAAKLTAQATLAASQASIASLNGSLNELPTQLTMQKTDGFPNVAADNMRQEFFKLQISNRELETRLGAEHPLVKAAVEQTRKLEEVLRAEAADRTQTTTGINASKQTLDLELKREEALSASTQAKLAELEQQYTQLVDRMRKLNEYEVRIADLQREVEIAETAYRSYTASLEQARVADALEDFHISNISVIQPPSLIEKPISPNSTVILGMGLLMAGFGSVALVIGSDYERRSRSHHTNGSAAPHSVPVLGAIPRANPDQVILNR